MQRTKRGIPGAFLGLLLLLPTATAFGRDTGDVPAPADVARRIDAVIRSGIEADGTHVAPLVDDEQFLRRASLGIAGRLPYPEELTAFVIDPAPDKRRAIVDDLLVSESYARNWARYWKEAILARAQDQRARRVAGVLEDWLAEQFRADRGWDGIVSDLLTAEGVVSEDGSTGLVFSQMAQPVELAAETSRLFLGVQIQCAQCHDHPYDDWTREQFHELAAFFPRVRIQRNGKGGSRSFEVASFDAPAARVRRPGGAPDPKRLLARFDRNRDGRLARDELPHSRLPFFKKVLSRLDGDGDGLLTLKELEKLKRIDQNRNRGRGEHFMPDLENPRSRGALMQPVFFLGGASPGEFTTDDDRRGALARYMTSPENPWFARAYVNRMWAELIGRGFYEPVDDMGPGRDAELTEALDVLADGFVRSGASTRWLVRTIAATETFQRRGLSRTETNESSRFAAVCAVRLTADQVFDSLVRALKLDPQTGDGGASGGRRRRGARGLRALFGVLFGYDPSTPQEDVTGTIPQALFLMNSRVIQQGIEARGRVLGNILREIDDDTARVKELYLRVLAREPRAGELETSLDYIRETESREEAYEDLFWCLLNSTEFLTRK